MEGKGGALGSKWRDICIQPVFFFFYIARCHSLAVADTIFTPRSQPGLSCKEVGTELSGL